MAHSVYSETGTDTGFDGKLRGVTLANLIQLECLSDASDCIYITSEAKSGTLHFCKGSITHATAGDLTGDEAVLELLTWTSGTFDLASLAAPRESSVRRSWQGLLLEAATAQDERHRYVPLLNHRREGWTHQGDKDSIPSPFITNARILAPGTFEASDMSLARRR